MSIYAALDGVGGTQIGSNTGWGDFTRWVNTLTDVPDLKHLVEEGWDENLDAVVDQIDSGLIVSPPGLSAGGVAETLVQVLNNRGTATVLTITNGMEV